QFNGAGEGRAASAVLFEDDLVVPGDVVLFVLRKAHVADHVAPAGLGAHVRLVGFERDRQPYLGEELVDGTEMQRLAVHKDAVHIEDDRCEPRQGQASSSAAAPPTMSRSSFVICSWRALL